MKILHTDFAKTKVFGDLYQADEKELDKAIIVMVGSDGDYEMSRRFAVAFGRSGVDALAIAYCGEKGLPKAVKEIPVETIQYAIDYLKGLGYKRIGICGVGKSAEFALVAASYLPEITCVVAISPSSHIYEGIASHSMLQGTSSWSYKGKPLPYVPLKMSFMFFLNHCLQENQFDTRFMYDEALDFPHGEALIQVQRIKGPILFLSADYDSIWPSREACVRLMEYLKTQKFGYATKHCNYRYGSHLLIPIDSGAETYFKVEKDFPAECDASKEEAFKQAVLWFKEKWDE